MERREKTLAQLLRDLIDQMSRVVRHEIGLARAEMSEKADRAMSGLVMLGLALAFAVGGIGVLLASAVLGLSAVVEPWLAALIVGVVVVLLAVVMAASGIARVRPRNLMPSRTIDSLGADYDFAREKMR